jgi:Na+/H+ antiporter NhaA
MRKIRYVACNGAFATLLYLGITEGVTGAANIAMVWAWFVSIMTLFCMNDDAVEKMRQRGWAMPAWFDVAFAVSIVAFMVWHGWVATGLAYGVHIVFVAAIRDKSQQPTP